MSDRRKPHVWLDEQQILRVRYAEDGRIGLSDIKSAFEQYLAIPNAPSKIAVLILNSSGLNTSLEAEDYALTQGVAAITLARASLVPSASMATAANHFFSLRPLPYPTRAFVTEAQAVAWLMSFQSAQSTIAPQRASHFQVEAPNSWGLCPLS